MCVNDIICILHIVFNKPPCQREECVKMWQRQCCFLPILFLFPL